VSEENGGSEKQLTGLQRAFVNAWFGDARFNATEAARLAGYSGGDDPEKERDVWASQGAQTLRYIQVQKEIERRWEAHGATAAEVVSRLANWMRFDMSNLLDDNGGADLGKIHEFGDCIKKLEITEVAGAKRYKIEAHDQMRAAELVGKTMRLFVEGVDVTSGGEPLKAYVGISPDDWDDDE